MTQDKRLAHAAHLWEKSNAKMGSAQREIHHNPDEAASCAYYAAFNAVKAALIMEGIECGSHDAVFACLHKNLIHKGIIPVETGKHYNILREKRAISDYGELVSISKDQAADMIKKSKQILSVVSELHPDIFETTQNKTELPTVEINESKNNSILSAILSGDKELAERLIGSNASALDAEIKKNTSTRSSHGSTETPPSSAQGQTSANPAASKSPDRLTA